MRLLAIAAILLPVLCAQSETQLHQSIARALPLVQKSAAVFVAKRSCVSCHHNILPILLLHLARERGVSIDNVVLSTVEEKTFRELRQPAALDEAIQASTLSDPTPNDSFLLMAAHAANIAPSLTTAVYAHRLVHWQREGHWITSDFRPPHSSSLFTATATAVRAIRWYLPEELHAEADDSILRARRWLAATRPASTEDATFRLLGLVWAGASKGEINAAGHDLAALQQAGGGWPELPGYPADAYSTGEALYALREAHMAADADSIQRRGLRFLFSTQAPDGSWHVHTRMISPARVSPSYFSTGFPYQKDEYLSYAGTCWAVMAMLSALPENQVQPNPRPAGQTVDGLPWVRTALFGTPLQLAALLDAGLDPNSRTPNGTTLLMMAAPEAEKVRLLLSRGANARARAPSGCDALTIAAAYRNTAASLRLLVEAGAEVQAPQGIRVTNSPLLFASMTGDRENVDLLLAHGADPSASPSHASTPLAAAVTFGYADVAQSLIDAGAAATLTESTGINLLHWAVISNHPGLIPVLVRAGVRPNATDENGFTPLMYAATIDFGDARSIQALREAGADPSIRNDDGRSAIEQARYFHHSRLEAALR